MGRWCHYSGVHALRWSLTISPNLPTFQLAFLQLGGSIASGVFLHDAKLFGHFFRPTAAVVCSSYRTSYGKSSTLLW